MNYLHKIILIAFSAGICIAVADANAPSEREELLGIKNTIVNLIDELVVAGVLEEEKADLMKQRAEAKAKLQAAQEAQEAEELETSKKAADEEAVRVQYVPDHVKQEIRDQVRAELKQEVVDEVMVDAKNEILGVPDLIPNWMKKLRISGDARLRHQTDAYADDNELVTGGVTGISQNVEPDFLALNAAQKDLDTVSQIPTANQNPNEFFKNRVRTRNRFRQRLRLSLDTEITNDVDFGMRLTTGNINNPVSLNQTLGNDGRRYLTEIDRLFLKYTDLDENSYPWLTVWGGRFKNPFFSTQLVFDVDLSYEGFALQFKKNLAGSDSLLALNDNSKTLFATFGAFPIDEIEFSAQDKWMLGAQIGSELVFDDQSKFKFAVSYYDYINTRGKRNNFAGVGATNVTFQEYDYTAPTFLQGGNTMFDIRNDQDVGAETALYALASDFNQINLTASYDWTGLAPIHLIFTGDVVYNIGYDEEEIFNNISEGGNGVAALYQSEFIRTPTQADLKSRNLGYYVKLTAGWPDYTKGGKWQVFGGYKYLQRDAVLDAFTESNFQGGGTNGKGFILGGRYGIVDDVFMQARYFSTDQIDGPKLGFDIFQLDLSAKF